MSNLISLLPNIFDNSFPILPASQGITVKDEQILDHRTPKLSQTVDQYQKIISICYEKAGDLPNKNRNFTVQN